MINLLFVGFFEEIVWEKLGIGIFDIRKMMFEGLSIVNFMHDAILEISLLETSMRLLQ